MEAPIVNFVLSFSLLWTAIAWLAGSPVKNMQVGQIGGFIPRSVAWHVR